MRISDWSSDVCSSDLQGLSLFMLAPSERPPDQFLHDLVGAAEDTGDARRAPCAGDRIFVHIARAAEQLQALVHHLPLQLGVPQLRRGALFELGRAHVRTQVPNAPSVCRLTLEKKK